MIDRGFESQLRGWSLTTAEIMYRMPDYRGILQTYLWQDYDIAPKFPRLIKFLDFWTKNSKARWPKSASPMPASSAPPG